MKRIKQWTSALSLTTLTMAIGFLLFNVAAAQGLISKTGIVTSANDIGPNLFCKVITVFETVVIAVSIIMALMAAFYYTTAGDDTEKTTKARKTLTYAAVGIVVALLAYEFPVIVGSIFQSGAVNNLGC